MSDEFTTPNERRVTAALNGPADASNFRVKVGRFSDRWYTDPLPGCKVADASDWHGPSVSVTKPPFANKYVPMRSIAEMPDAEWARLAGVTSEERYEAVKTHDKLTGRVNMDRGSIVHRWAEDLLAGRPIPPAELDDKATRQAVKFRPALEAFFDTYQPEPIAVEVVCLHRTLNGVGYGGTADAFAAIEDDLWAIDYKSRLSDHAAYLEEAAQGGAYIGAEYMVIADDDGNPYRVPVPDVAGVLIVSIRADGFKVFPIERDGAIAAYHEMHRWWVAQRRFIDDKVIGRPWAPTAEPSGDRREHLRRRYRELTNEQQLAFVAVGADVDDLDAVEAALDQVDPFAQVTQPNPRPRGRTQEKARAAS